MTKFTNTEAKLCYYNEVDNEIEDDNTEEFINVFKDADEYEIVLDMNS
jgi:hypothetical protein